MLRYVFILEIKVHMVTPLIMVVNPAAGGGKAARCLPAVRAVLDAAGVRYQTCQSDSLRHACTLAAEAAERGDRVVAVGGDGMAGAIAGAVAQARPRGDGVFGIIPAGRGNDFARTHSIPFSPSAAAQLLLAGQSRPMDLIAISGADGTQLTVAGSVYFGIASVAGQIANETRLIRGPLVYPVAALRALANWKPASFTVDATGSAPQDGAIVPPQEFVGYGVVIANFPYFGAGMKVAPAADASDGWLEIVRMHQAPKFTFLRLLMKTKNGAHVNYSQVGTGRAQTITITFDRSLKAGADGESFYIEPPLRISAVPHALSVIVPEGGQSALR
jgi:diacylglycerol kinase (ATP)